MKSTNMADYNSRLSSGLRYHMQIRFTEQFIIKDTFSESNCDA